jgi:hypothetical protein
MTARVYREGLPQGTETVCHGLLRDPRPNGGRPTPTVAMPDPLVFYSWWNEEVAMLPEFTPSGQGMGVRRQVRLHYLPRHGSFQLFTEDANAALTLTIEHADGTPVRAHELHVGAKVGAPPALELFPFVFSPRARMRAPPPPPPPPPAQASTNPTAHPNALPVSTA